jgi:hypothetical protein
MSDATQVQCPWCWESISLYIDPDTTGEFVEDCEVCCRPWAVRVTRGTSQESWVEVLPGNQ